MGVSPLETKAVTLSRGGGHTHVIMLMLPTPVCIFLFLSLSLPSSLCAGTTVGEHGMRDILPIFSFHACAFNKLIFHNVKEKGKLSFVTQCVSRKHSTGPKQFHIATGLRLPSLFVLQRQGAAKTT